jgi:hypothetical protein
MSVVSFGLSADSIHRTLLQLAFQVVSATSRDRERKFVSRASASRHQHEREAAKNGVSVARVVPSSRDQDFLRLRFLITFVPHRRATAAAAYAASYAGHDAADPEQHQNDSTLD